MVKLILWTLEEGTIDEKVVPIPKIPSITLPRFDMSKQDMSKRIECMDAPEFWLQQGLKNENQSLHRFDYASVFYRQGLRKNPINLTLLYNFGRCSLYLC